MSIFNSKYNQGVFMPVNVSKCLNYNGKMGDNKPIHFRSSWEKILCNFCDAEVNVLEYGSEILKIKYFSNIDNKEHLYITDFIMTTRSKDGSIKKWVVEVKPNNQVANLDEFGNILMPEPPIKQNSKNLLKWQETCNVIRRNNEKWTAARRYCKEHGYIFKIISEKELGLTFKKV